MTSKKKESEDFMLKSTKLAEERTELAFIRTIAIFCGMYVLLKKNIDNNKNTNNILKIFLGGICYMLLYRLYHLKNITNKNYVLMVGMSVAFCIILILILI